MIPKLTADDWKAICRDTLRTGRLFIGGPPWDAMLLAAACPGPWVLEVRRN